MRSVVELSKKNPWRPPDWRWQRATLIALGEVPEAVRGTEPSVRRLAKFAQLAVEAEDEGARILLASKSPDMFWAYQLYGQEDPGPRAEIEARIMARQTLTEISQKTGVDVSILEKYAQHFFDVADKLDHPSYVIHSLIGSALHRGLQEREYATIWKYIAYKFGPVAFEAYMHQAVQPTQPRDPSGVQACFKDAGLGYLLRKQMIAALTIPLNQFTQPKILDTYMKLLEIDKMAGSDGGAGASSSLVANVQAVLNCLPDALAIGSFAQPRIDAPLLSRYDDSPSELPTPLLLMAAQGHQVNTDDIPHDLEYPELPNHARNEQGS